MSNFIFKWWVIQSQPVKKYKKILRFYNILFKNKSNIFLYKKIQTKKGQLMSLRCLQTIKSNLINNKLKGQAT